MPTTGAPTMTPTDESYWSLPELNYVGDNVASSALPLGLCEGKFEDGEWFNFSSVV
jgi:hypothetical protein